MKPILFNTEMVQAILEGRKTQTRRVIKFPEGTTGHLPPSGARDYIYYPGGIKYPSYKPGDILWVRETWKVIRLLKNMQMQFEYRADGVISKTIDFLLDRFTKFKKFADKNGWQSPYFMPREAARIFLRVTNVRVERLQEITVDGCKAEGIYDDYKTTSDEYHKALVEIAYPIVFSELWNSTIKKQDLDKYSWEVNPWVWVYEFERVSEDD